MSGFRKAYRIVYQRDPSDEELATGLEFLEIERKRGDRGR